MSTPFRHVALFGKYQAQGVRPMLEEIAQFLVRSGVEVSVDHDTAMNSDWSDYGAMRIDELAQVCDLAVVVGGDGTMLGIGRELARHGIPLIGINQGRLGFITDIAAHSLARGAGPDDPGRLRGREPPDDRRRRLARRRADLPGLRAQRRGGAQQHVQHDRAARRRWGPTTWPTSAPTA
jgi:hypothetical protein